MSTLELQPAARHTAAGGPAPAVLAHRRSTLGGPGAIAAPPVRDAGRPLQPDTRAAMESGFGCDFGQIRVHDDAQAHDSARSLNALAYAAGNDLVFGEGCYRPGTPSGDALIAHELAHSIQQGGVQLKAEGPLAAAADARLEAEADRAAEAITAGRPAPAVSAAPAPAVLRATTPPVPGTDPAASPTAKPAETAPATRLPAGMTAIRDDPPGVGTTELVLAVQSFALPREKGAGNWVEKAYAEAAGGQRLVFSPLIEGGRVAAYKEDSKTDVYAGIWCRNFGFPTLSALGRAIQAAARTDPAIKDAIDPAKQPAARKIVEGLAAGSLTKAGCDVDHIVEKQMGGTSIPSNLQLLDATKNRTSGREAYLALKGLVDQIRDPAHRGPGARNVQLVLRQVTVAPATLDASFEVETLLRSGAVKGSAAIAEAAAGKPVAVSAGGVGETVRLPDKGKAPIPEAAKRIVAGIKLGEYTRSPAGPAGKIDKVDGQLDNRAIRATGVADPESLLTLEAELAPAAGPIGTAAGGEAASENLAAQAPAGERRVLRLPNAPKKVKFFYPYLSPGYLTSYSLDDQGQLSGEGYISPSVRFLGDIKIAFGPDRLDMIAPIDVAQVNASRFMAPLKPTFRFTEGSVSIDLMKFKPTGELKFTVGPAAKPLLNGAINAGLDGGIFAATGTLAPAGTIPGISAADGKAGWKSDTGWWGEIAATSSSIPKSTVNAKLGFKEVGGAFRPYGEGGITTQVRGAALTLELGWRGGAVSYRGGVTVQDPLPLVKSVRLRGAYANQKLTLTGEAPIKWRNIDATMAVTYTRRDGDEEGHFSGKADVAIKTGKMEGNLQLNFDEAGNWWGGGALFYQVTPSLRPKLGVDIGRDRRILLSGGVDIGTIPLSKKWPSEKGGEIPIIKGVGAKFSIPTPVPGITAYGEIRGSLVVTYSVGPVQLVGVSFNGKLYPFEDDPQIKAQLKGKLWVPGYGALRGTIGASIGVEVLLGAVGAKGGINANPELGVRGEGAVEFDASYEQGGFAFGAEAYAKGQMYARIDVDLDAEIYAAWGLFSHTWTYPVGSVQKNLGPELKVTLGRIAYARDGTITWPNPSQIEVSPKEIDPIQIVKELMSEGKATET